MPVVADSEYVLYHYDESLCSQMVRLALEEKEIAWTSHPVSLSELERDADHLKDEYLAINPKAMVPTLVHNDQAVFDSWVIIDYLDKQAPGRGARLTPQDADSERKMKAFMAEASLDENGGLGTTLGLATPALTLPVLRYCLKQQPILHVLWKYRKHPLPVRRWGNRISRLLPLPQGLSLKAVDTVARNLRQIERDLGAGGEYLLGDYSQADIMLAAHLHRLEDVGLGEVLQDESILPKTAHYWARLQARPAYKMAILDRHDPVMRAALKAVFKDEASPLLERLRSALT
jgi:glutathione S-transferase